jgi:hypothetical protein
MTDDDARAAIRAAITKYHDLTIDGLGGLDRRNFKARQKALFDEENVRAFKDAMEWFGLVRRGPVDKGYGSYGVKHTIERWGETYIANGSVIAAADASGIEIERCISGINARLGVASSKGWPRSKH